MKTYILVYDEFAHFEAVLAGLFMKSKSEIITVGIDKKEITSEEGFRLVPHISLDEVNVDEVDLFIVPGGNPEQLLKVGDLSQLLVDLNRKGKTIGAICAGPIHLAKAGLLKGRKFTTSMPVDEFSQFEGGTYIGGNVAVDGNIVTAKGNGYVDFALTLGKVMNIFEDDKDYEETVSYFREFKG